MELYNADCLELLNTLPEVDAVVTDPPYYVIPRGKPGDNFTWDSFKNLDDFGEFTENWFQKCYSLLKDNSLMFVFWSQKYLELGYEIFHPSRLLLWHYSNLVIGGNGDFAWDYEPIFCIKKGNAKIVSGKHSCIFNYTKPQSNFKTDKLLHPTQKPLALLEKLISLLPDDKNMILDPFMGAGTTGVACKKLNKDFIGIEKETKYFNIAKDRIDVLGDLK